VTRRMEFEIEGPFQPYTRMTRRGKFVSKRAKKYLESQDALSWQFKAQMQANGWEMVPRGVPLRVEVEIVRPNRLHGRDMSNELKALEDAMNGVVYYDDRYIDESCQKRCVGDACTVRVVVERLE